MELVTGTLLIEILSSLRYAMSDMNPALFDVAKMLVGSTAWIGGLAAFMWMRERRKQVVAVS